MSKPNSPSSAPGMLNDPKYESDPPIPFDDARPSGARPEVGDAALEILGSSAAPVDITPEQDAAVLRKVDLWVMPVILLVYFLQQLDK